MESIRPFSVRSRVSGPYNRRARRPMLLTEGLPFRHRRQEHPNSAWLLSAWANLRGKLERRRGQISRNLLIVFNMKSVSNYSASRTAFLSWSGPERCASRECCTQQQNPQTQYVAKEISQGYNHVCGFLQILAQSASERTFFEERRFSNTSCLSSRLPGRIAGASAINQWVEKTIENDGSLMAC